MIACNEILERFSGAFDIMTIATSACGFKTIIKVLSGLPANFPASIVIAKYLDSRHRSMMAERLIRRISLKTVAASYKDHTIAVVLSDTGNNAGRGHIGRQENGWYLDNSG